MSPVCRGPGHFKFVAREWLAKVHRIKVSAGHADRTQIRLEQDAFPGLAVAGEIIEAQLAHTEGDALGGA